MRKIVEGSVRRKDGQTPGQAASQARKRAAQKARAVRLQEQADKLKIPVSALLVRLGAEFEAGYQSRKQAYVPPPDPWSYQRRYW